MSGYSEKELLAMRVPDLAASETVDQIAARIQKIMAQGKDRFETRHHHKDGRIYDVEVSIQYRSTDGGQLVVFLHDITERKHAEEQLRQAHDEMEVRVRERTAELARANEDLLRLNRAKDEFAATVSHELRTPLVTGLGYVEMLLEGQFGPITTGAATGMRTALRNLRRLSSMINDILSYHSLVAQETEPGRGTRVSFILTAAQSLPPSRPAATEPSQGTPDSRPGDILVVDDDADTLEFMRLLLGGRGYIVRTAASAREALAAFAERPADLVLADLSLPDMDGAELCRRLKSGAGPGRPPVYMFSARAEIAARRRAEEAGCDGYLLKPAAAVELLNTVRGALAGRK
jgi:CheY-like chemotaxis protein